jgi:hypothetical protein
MTGTNLINYEERFRQDAQAHAQREARSGAQLSLRGGVFSLGGKTLGPKIAVVVLDSIFENNFFNPNYPFESENPLPPMCYAMSRLKSDLAPYERMQDDMTWFVPQSPWNIEGNRPGPCSQCKKNEWGSSERGRGKACQNRERLFVIPAGYYQPPNPRAASELHMYEDPAHFRTADVIGLRLPVTSGENWAKYVTQLDASLRRPSYAVFTEVTLEPHPKSQFKVNFDVIESIPDSLFEIIIGRVDAQVALPFPAFTAPTAEQRQPPSQVRSAAAGFGRR